MTYKEYGKDFQKKSSMDRFMEPFIYASDFRNDKRFARYVSKVRSACEKTIREEFDELSERDRDVFYFIAGIIKEEAEYHYFESEEFKEKLRALQESEPEEDNEELDEELDELDDFDDDDDELDDEVDYDYMKFVVKRRHDELGVESDFDILDEIDGNFRYLHDYKFKDHNIDKLWMAVLSIFTEHESLMNVLSADTSEYDEAAHEILSHKDTILHNYSTVQNIIEAEFDESCFEYLHSRIAEENSTVNYDNFTIHGLPRGDGEAMSIVRNTIDHAAMDLLNCTREENAVTFESRDGSKIYKEAIAKAKEEIEAVRDELEKEKEKNFTLRKKLQGFDEAKNKEFESLKEENKELYHEKSKLEKRNTALEAECERLKKMIADMQRDAIEEDEDVARNGEKPVEVDTTKKYIFIMDGYPFGEEQILKTFPNSQIVGDYVEFNPLTVDAVVCITSRVKHYVYYSTKDYCKKKGVPFIHSTRANPEMIKRAIAECEK